MRGPSPARSLAKSSVHTARLSDPNRFQWVSGDQKMRETGGLIVVVKAIAD